jgi:glycosyltransferase involved in cell wall biosynthesis
MKISIIVPAYNEEEAISFGLEKFVSLGYHKKYELIYINDGSTDKTEEIIRTYPVKIFNHHVNKGYGAALKTGIRKATGDKIIILDSDGQHNPEYIEQIVELLNEYDMVIGERNKESFQVKRRQAGKNLIRRVGEFLVEQKLPDYNSGFRGFDKELMREMLHLMPNGFSMSTTSTLAFLKEGYTIGTFPIQVEERIGRKSNVRMVKDGSKTMLLLLRIIMLFNPLKIFFPLSLIIGFVGFVWGVVGFFISSRLPNSAIIILSFGIIMFFIGLLADQVAMLNRIKR